MKSKVFLLFLFFSLKSNLVYRIIRPRNYIDIDFQNDRFKEYVDKEFTNFHAMLETFEEELKECLEHKSEKPELAHVVCLGENFQVYEERFLLLQYKIKSIFENIIDLLVNQNCNVYPDAELTCLLILEDIKFLLANEYEVVNVMDANKRRYLNEHLPEDRFDIFFSLLVHCINKYDDFNKELAKLEQIIKGRLWFYFEEHILHKPRAGNHIDEHVAANPILEGENQISFKIMSSIAKKYHTENSVFRDFIKLEGMPNPFEAEDEILEAEMDQRVFDRFEEAKKRTENRNARLITKSKIGEDCSQAPDYNACFRQKILLLFKEDIKKGLI